MKNNKVMFLNKRLLILLTFSNLFSCMLSQSAAKSYAFLKKEYNHLYFSKDSSTFLKLYEKMQGLKNKETNRIGVVHFGGSHVQAGIWSGTFVNALQNEFKTNGGGYFVFPYKLANTNGQSFATSFSNGIWKRYRAIGKDYCLPLGMCALSVSTKDSASYFGVKLTTKAVSKQFNAIKVYHNFNSGFTFTPDSIVAKITSRIDVRQAGYTLFRFNTPIDSIKFNLLRMDSVSGEFILFGFSLDNDTPGFYLAGLGANGAASNSFNKCFDLSSQFKSLEADLVILSLGVNDTQSKDFGKDEFIENYDSLIMVIKSVSPDAAIILTTTSDNFIKRKKSNNKSITAKDAMFELMEKHNIAVWDLFTLMGGYKSMLNWQKAGLAGKDRVHFTNKGYILLGNLMYEALMKSYSNNIKTE